MCKKPNWFYKQSAVIPIINGKIVLVTSRKKKRWIIPKGIIEKNMTPWDSAAKEAFEEAGLLGVVESKKIGTFKHEKWGGVCTVSVFLLHVEKVLKKWDEMNIRDRTIVSPKKAASLLTEKKLKKIIYNLRLSSEKN